MFHLYVPNSTWAGLGDFGQTFKVLFFPVLDLSSGEFITVR